MKGLLKNIANEKFIEKNIANERLMKKIKLMKGLSKI